MDLCIETHTAFAENKGKKSFANIYSDWNIKFETLKAALPSQALDTKLIKDVSKSV